MRIVVVHNRYRSSSPSGENRVVDDDLAELAAAGHHVVPYVRDSDEIVDAGPLVRASLAVRPTVSPVDVAAFRRLLSEVDPHVVHLHNPYPMISPWIVRTAASRRVPVVQTVHNYRHTCVNGIHFRDGARCTACLDTVVPWPAVRHGCYQGSSLASLPMAVAQVAHRSTWQLVDRFLPVGEAVATHLRELGIPDERITVRPNEVADPGPSTSPGTGVLFAGRLSEEKGVGLLLEAWRRSGLGRHTTLTIAGDGELRPLVTGAARDDGSISYVGFLGRAELDALYRSCALVVVPSQCAEADPIAAVTALAHGRAVVATDLGALPTVAGDGCGWICAAEPDALADALASAVASPAELVSRGDAARRRFLATRARGSRPSLEEVYERVASTARGSVVVVGPDGAGKSTVVARLATEARAEGVPVTMAHFRPGTAVPRSAVAQATDVTDPHAQLPRGRLAASARTIVVWSDFLVGWWGPWRRAARRGLLVIERPFVDQAVDPRRYRLPASLAASIRMLARLLPRADVAVLLTGDPDEMHRRKPEIDREEVVRQLDAWRRDVAVAGHRTAVVPSVDVPLDETVDRIRTAMSSGRTGPIDVGWRRPMLHPPRLDLRVTAAPVPVAALGIHRPQKRAAAVAAGVGRSLALAGFTRSAGPPPVPIDELLADLGIAHHGLVAMRSSTQGRWVVGVEGRGRLTHVVKVGAADDIGLGNEASVMERIHGTGRAWRTPTLVHGGPWREFRVVATEAIVSTARGGVSVEDVAEIATELTAGSDTRPPLVHGDLAPWNCRRLQDGSVAVVDWERCTEGSRPLLDLAHFIVSQGVLVGTITPDDAVRLLSSPGSPGAEHLRCVAPELDPRSVVLDLLRELRFPDHPHADRYRRRMRALL